MAVPAVAPTRLIVITYAVPTEAPIASGTTTHQKQHVVLWNAVAQPGRDEQRCLRSCAGQVRCRLPSSTDAGKPARRKNRAPARSRAKGRCVVDAPPARLIDIASRERPSAPALEPERLGGATRALEVMPRSLPPGQDSARHESFCMASVRRRVDDDKLSRRGSVRVGAGSAGMSTVPQRHASMYTSPLRSQSPTHHSLFTPEPPVSAMPMFSSTADRALYAYDTSHGRSFGTPASSTSSMAGSELPESYLQRLRDTVSSARRQREECQAQLQQHHPNVYSSMSTSSAPRAQQERWTLPPPSDATPVRRAALSTARGLPGPTFGASTVAAAAAAAAADASAASAAGGASRRILTARELETEALVQSSHRLALSAMEQADAAMRTASGRPDVYPSAGDEWRVLSQRSLSPPAAMVRAFQETGRGTWSPDLRVFTRRGGEAPNRTHHDYRGPIANTGAARLKVGAL